jgi:hypothetical protein
LPPPTLAALKLTGAALLLGRVGLDLGRLRVQRRGALGLGVEQPRADVGRAERRYASVRHHGVAGQAELDVDLLGNALLGLRRRRACKRVEEGERAKKVEYTSAPPPPSN